MACNLFRLSSHSSLKNRPATAEGWINLKTITSSLSSDMNEAMT